MHINLLAIVYIAAVTFGTAGWLYETFLKPVQVEPAPSV